MDTVEEWRAIEGWPYEVSSLGRLRRTKGGHNTFAGKIIHGSPDDDGYLRSTLCNKGRVKMIRFHKIVCTLFNGPCPSDKSQAAHRDGNNQNNWATNLYWATPLENSADQITHGVQVHGLRHPISKLTPETVLALRRTYDEGGISFKTLAEKFGVTPRAAWLAYKGLTWSRVKSQTHASSAISSEHNYQSQQNSSGQSPPGGTS